jgi:hypothetical protein
MAGIGTQTEPAPEQAPAEIDEQGMEQPTPEEQALYEKFVQTTAQVMMDGEQNAQFRPEIVNNLRGEFDPQVAKMFEGADPPISDQPADALAVTGVIVTMIAEAQLAQAGTEIPHEIIYHAGTEVIGQLAEAAEAAGIADFSEEQIGDAFLRALDLYRQSSPNVDQQALSSEFEEIVAADREGRLDQVLPGASKLAPAAEEEPTQ